MQPLKIITFTIGYINILYTVVNNYKYIILVVDLVMPNSCYLFDNSNDCTRIFHRRCIFFRMSLFSFTSIVSLLRDRQKLPKPTIFQVVSGGVLGKVFN